VSLHDYQYDDDSGFRKVYIYGHKIRFYILLNEEGSIHKMTKRKIFTDEFKTMITKLVLSGKTVKEIAREYSVSETAVRKLV
jgi:DNA-binding NarL/FixJ family response regulator